MVPRDVAAQSTFRIKSMCARAFSRDSPGTTSSLQLANQSSDEVEAATRGVPAVEVLCVALLAARGGDNAAVEGAATGKGTRWLLLVSRGAVPALALLFPRVCFKHRVQSAESGVKLHPLPSSSSVSVSLGIAWDALALADTAMLAPFSPFFGLCATEGSLSLLPLLFRRRFLFPVRSCLTSFKSASVKIGFRARKVSFVVDASAAESRSLGATCTRQAGPSEKARTNSLNDGEIVAEPAAVASEGATGGAGSSAADAEAGAGAGAASLLVRSLLMTFAAGLLPRRWDCAGCFPTPPSSSCDPFSAPGSILHGALGGDHLLVPACMRDKEVAVGHGWLVCGLSELQRQGSARHWLELGENSGNNCWSQPKPRERERIAKRPEERGEIRDAEAASRVQVERDID